MNIEKIFNSLDDDQDNSALAIIVQELENQGYEVLADDVSVSSESIFNGEHSEIENKITPINLSLLRNGDVEQKFSIEFTDFHEISIKKACD